MLSETKKDVFVCVCVCLRNNEALNVEYLLKWRKKKHNVRGRYSLCGDKNEIKIHYESIWKQVGEFFESKTGFNQNMHFSWKNN